MKPKAYKSITFTVFEGVGVEELKKYLRYPNPNYHIVKHKNPFTPQWLTPVRIHRKLHLPMIPTGLFPVVQKKFDFEIAHDGSVPPLRAPFLPTSPSLDLTYLRDYQQEAVKALLSAGIGYAQIPSGGGKTYIVKALCECVEDFPTLVVCFTKEQKFQILKLVGNMYWVKVVTYAAFKNEDLDSYRVLITDECLVGGTKILLTDGTQKDINCIEKGDSIPQSSVVGTLKRLAYKTVSLYGPWGKIEATKNHILPCIPKRNRKKGWAGGKRRYSAEQESDVVEIPIGQIEIGDLLLSPPQISHTVSSNISSTQSRFLALVLCDGTVDRRNTVKCDFVKDLDWLENEFRRGVAAFGTYPVGMYATKRGGKVFLVSRKEFILRLVELGVPVGKKCNVMRVPRDVMNASLDAIKNFIQVCFDCEGHVYEKNPSIKFEITSEVFVQELVFLLRKFGIIGRVWENDSRNKSRPRAESKSWRLMITGIDLVRFHEEIGFSIKRKQNILAFVVEKCNPRFERIVKYLDEKWRLLPVYRIEENESMNKPVYDFKTTSGHYIANLVLSHNCQHVGAPFFETYIHNSQIPARFAVSGTVDGRSDGKDYLLQGYFWNLVYSVDRHTLQREGYIRLPAKVKMVTLYPPQQPSDVEEYVISPERSAVIAKTVELLQKDHKRVLVLVDRLRQLQDMFDACNSKPKFLVCSQIPDSVRMELLNLLPKLDSYVVFATSVYDEGTDIPNINCIVLGSPIVGSKIKLSQRLGRGFRAGGENLEIIDIIDSIPKLKRKARKRKAIYQELGYKVEEC